MSIIACTYFDGRTSTGHAASLVVSAGAIRLVGRELDIVLAPDRLRLSRRVADTPRWIYLPDGGACMVADNAPIDRIARRGRLETALLTVESHAAWAAVATLIVIALFATLIRFGIPAAASVIAGHLPPATVQQIGGRTLASLDRHWLQPSALSSARRAAVRGRMDALLRAEGGRAVRLEFRNAPRVGPNAFALPGDIIVVTDQLVALARHDDEVAGVLAHELGHLRLNHAMRGLLEGSAAALLVAAVTGDIASTSTLAASAPALLLQNKFSRDNEAEADRFALDLLRRAGIDSLHLADLLTRLPGQRGAAIPVLLASHPATAERIAAARAASNGTRAARPSADPRP